LNQVGDLFELNVKLRCQKVNERSWMIHKVNLELLWPVLRTGGKIMWLLA
jgi:hypothetical protein